MRWVAAGAWCAAVSVMAGAFGAHGLASRLDARGLELWETGARYLMYAGLALAVLGSSAARADGGGRFHAAAWALLAGGAVFSGTLFAMALGAPRWLGAITPLGGLGMIGGLLLFGWVAAGGHRR